MRVYSKKGTPRFSTRFAALSCTELSDSNGSIVSTSNKVGEEKAIATGSKDTSSPKNRYSSAFVWADDEEESKEEQAIGVTATDVQQTEEGEGAGWTLVKPRRAERVNRAPEKLTVKKWEEPFSSFSGTATTKAIRATPAWKRFRRGGDGTIVIGSRAGDTHTGPSVLPLKYWGSKKRSNAKRFTSQGMSVSSLG